MSIGTPFLDSPKYNRNGVLRFLHTRARGFHIALAGNPCDWLSYTAKIGYEKAGGAGKYPSFRRLESTSAMIDASVVPVSKIPGFKLNVCVAFDAGELRGDNWGVRLQMSYSGGFKIRNKK